jgi:tRNA dimethylallyltransferase
MTKDKYLISIVGPTAIGKTALSIALARHYNTEIISTDSRQFYKEMQVGTAVPTKKELSSAQHHFIQHLSIHDSYSVGDFERDANALLDLLFKKHDKLVLVGGSGLFHKALVSGLDAFPEIDPKVRSSLNQIFRSKGLEALQKELNKLDPKTYKSIDIKNPQRVIRALEVCLGTGTPFSSYKTNQKKQRSFKTINIGLTGPRNLIYERINKRVDMMIKEGLLEEARSLFPMRNLNALNTVGYKELFAYFNNEYTLEEAIEKIKTNTRRFAKRQLTWFKKDPSIAWFEYDAPVKDIILHIDSKIPNKKNPA